MKALVAYQRAYVKAQARKIRIITTHDMSFTSISGTTEHQHGKRKERSTTSLIEANQFQVQYNDVSSWILSSLFCSAI